MISIFFYLLSIFCVVYYGVIIAYSGLRTSFVRFWLFAAAISAFAAVFLQSSIYLSLPSIIHRIIKLFTFIILAFFLIILLKIWNTQHFCKNQEVEADYLIVRVRSYVVKNRPMLSLHVFRQPFTIYLLMNIRLPF